MNTEETMEQRLEMAKQKLNDSYYSTDSASCEQIIVGMEENSSNLYDALSELETYAHETGDVKTMQHVRRAFGYLEEMDPKTGSQKQTLKNLNDNLTRFVDMTMMEYPNEFYYMVSWNPKTGTMQDGQAQRYEDWAGQMLDMVAEGEFGKAAEVVVGMANGNVSAEYKDIALDIVKKLDYRQARSINTATEMDLKLS